MAAVCGCVAPPASLRPRLAEPLPSRQPARNGGSSSPYAPVCPQLTRRARGGSVPAAHEAGARRQAAWRVAHILSVPGERRCSSLDGVSRFSRFPARDERSSLGGCRDSSLGPSSLVCPHDAGVAAGQERQQDPVRQVRPRDMVALAPPPSPPRFRLHVCRRAAWGQSAGRAAPRPAARTPPSAQLLTPFIAGPTPCLVRPDSGGAAVSAPPPPPSVLALPSDGAAGMWALALARI